MKTGEFKYIEDSRDTLEIKHRKKCFSNGIEVIVEAMQSSREYCKIHVTHNDRVIVEGKKFFSQYPTNGGSPLNQKVNELYEYYYNKIIAKESKTQHLGKEVA